MTPLLDIAGLCVRHGDLTALRDVALTIQPGQAVALLGSNGAGKTTLLRAVLGLLPAVGSILFDGVPLGRLPAHRRARLGIGYIPEGRRPFPGLSVRENLEVACTASAAERRRRVDHALALFPRLAGITAQPAWQLSGGQAGMLAIARSLMDRPRLLLLDEPALGLSPAMADAAFALLPAIVADGTAVLLAEQNAARALPACSHAVLLREGRVVAQGPAATMETAAIRQAFLGP
jgi:branched-chain amino acid transport system ATP-binding protein